MSDNSTAVSFTRREFQVVMGLATGKTDHEIARFLGRSKNTVRRYIATAKGKVGAKGQISLIARSYDLGLLQPPAREERTVDLPPQQRALIPLLALNMSKSEIQAELQLSRFKVGMLTRELMQALNARTRPHVMTRARQLGLLQLSTPSRPTVRT